MRGLAASSRFLFINDLAEKAHGAELIVLMVLFIGSQIASTLVMSVTADKTQQRIMLLLPLVFAALIPNFPAGLILYWITTNFWTLGPAAGGERLAPPPEVAAAAVRAGAAERQGPDDGDAVPAVSAGAGHEGASTASAEEEATAAMSLCGRRRGDAVQVEAEGDQRRRGEVGGDEAARAAVSGVRRRPRRVRGARGAARGGDGAGYARVSASADVGAWRAAEKEFAWPDEPGGAGARDRAADDRAISGSARASTSRRPTRSCGRTSAGPSSAC